MGTKKGKVRTRKPGILDQENKVDTPEGQGCVWLTKKGHPCPNPANYIVDDKWSCSRDHRRT